MPLFTGFGRRSHRPLLRRPASRARRLATTVGLLGERLESRSLMAADAGVMIAVAAGTLPESSLLKGYEVSAFQIAKYEVTLSDWQAVATWGSAEGRTYDLGSIGTGAAATNPVESVSWYDAVKWCNAKSEKDGLQPVYMVDNAVYRRGAFGFDGSTAVLADASKNGYRLPTRTEWEWAARGGTSSQGFTYSGSNTISDVAWYKDNSDGGAKAVGTKAANELGIHDMSGNAVEWCWNEIAAAQNILNPNALSSLSFINGGSWADVDWVCSFGAPGLELDPGVRLPGLRLARNAIKVGNNAPTGISLSASSIAENQPSGTVVGTLSTTDPDAADTSFTYSLVDGTGSTDNGLFTIDGGSLKAAAAFDFETKTSYSIRVRSTDQGNLSTDKQFTIKITNVVDAPTVTVPASFSVTEDVPGNLVWPASPAAFADADSPSLTVTLSVPRGTLATKAVTGIKITGDTKAKTFSGTSADLNKYFSKSGNIAYTTAANDTADVSLTTVAANGKLFAFGTSTIKVTPVNDAPTVTAPASFTVTEDVAGNLVWPASPAAFADVDSPSLTVTLTVQDGTLTAATVSGITVAGTATARTVTGSPADLNAYFGKAGNITYTTAPDNTIARTLTIAVSDGTLSASKTSTISITPVNDRPTLTVPASFTVTEDVAGNLVWPASPAAFADIDSSSLTVTLAVSDGAISVAPGIKLGGTPTARTFTGSPADLTKYFSKVGNIKYIPAINNTVSRTLTTTVSDGTLSDSKTSTISITPINDAPTVTVPASFTVTEDVAGNLVWPASPAAFADVDSPSLTVTLAVIDGALSASTVAGVTLGGTATARTFAGTAAALNSYFKTAGNIKYTTAANNTVSKTLTTFVTDGSLSAFKTSTISITPVNDKPTLTVPASFTVKEDEATNLFGPGSVAAFADVDSSKVTVTILVGSGTLTPTKAKNISLAETPADVSGLKGWTVTGTTQDLNTYFSTAGNVRFTTATDDTSDVTLFTAVSDDPKNPQSSSFAISTITVTPVNDAPTVRAPAAFTVGKNMVNNFFWPASPEAVGDVDSLSLTVTLEVADGTLTASAGSGIAIGGTPTAVTLAGSPSDLNAYLRFPGNVQYTPLLDNITARTLTTRVSDGLLASSTTSKILFNTAAPTVSAASSFTVTEDVAGNLVRSKLNWAFADVDSSSLTVTLAVADGTLTAKPATGITLDGPATARMFIGTPAALSAYFNTAGNIQYTTAPDNNESKILTTTVSDGMFSASTTSTIAITPVNDAPTAPIVPASFTVTEDVADNLVWPESPTAFADVDSLSLTVTLAVTDGTLTAASGGGVTVGGTATARTFAGSPAALNSYFQTAGNITYTTAANNTVSRTLTTTVSDGKLTSSKTTSTISITPVNDAPTVTAPASFTVTEDVAGNLFWPVSPVAFADIDSPSLTVTLAVEDGTLTATTGGGVTVDGTATERTFAGSPAALNSYFKTAGNIKYTTAANNTVSRTLTTTVSDDTLSDSKTSTISITPVNDAPTLAFLKSDGLYDYYDDIIVTIDSNIPVWFGQSFRYWSYTDPDGDLLTATFTIDSKYGTLQMWRSSTERQDPLGITITGGSFIQSPIIFLAGSTLSFTGTAAALDAFLVGGKLQYLDTAGRGGEGAKDRLLTVSLSDGKLSSVVKTWIKVVAQT